MKISDKKVKLDDLINEERNSLLKKAGEIRKKIEAIEDPEMKEIAYDIQMHLWQQTSLNQLRILRLERDLGQIEEESEKVQKLIKDIIEDNPLEIA